MKTRFLKYALIAFFLSTVLLSVIAFNIDPSDPPLAILIPASIPFLISGFAVSFALLAIVFSIFSRK